MLNVILATQNMNKIREMENILKLCGLDVKVYSAKDVGIYDFPEETGSTFSENAYIKAKGIFDVVKEKKNVDSPFVVIADDSGLSVSALMGKPGIYSARYASTDGKDASDEENLMKLLSEMEGIQEADRQAYFECAISAIFDDGKVINTQGRLNGFITFSPVGESGFGYDPVFYLPEEDCTVAQLSSEKKNQISHRANAINSLAQIIRKHIGET